MFCDNCGKKIQDKSKFCDHCGMRLTSRWPGHLLRFAKQGLGKIRKVNSHTLLIIFLLFVLAGGTAAFGYILKNTRLILNKTAENLEKTQSELAALRTTTQEAVASQKAEIAKKDAELNQKENDLKNSKASQEALQKTIKNIESKVLGANTAPTTPTSGTSGQLLDSFAPAVVQLACKIRNGGDGLKTGSGVLYKSTMNSFGYSPYYVQTNLHVVQTDDGSESECFILLRPDYKSGTAVLVFYSQSYRYYRSGIDLAFLKPQIITDYARAGTESDLQLFARDEKSSPVCDSASIGDHLTILGYPGSGGNSLTVTDGIISGFEDNDGTRYVKTSAKIDTGNSGGVAIKDSGCVVGIPTYVGIGQAEAIGRVLDLNYLFNNTLR